MLGGVTDSPLKVLRKERVLQSCMPLFKQLSVDFTVNILCLATLHRFCSEKFSGLNLDTVETKTCIMSR